MKIKLSEYLSKKLVENGIIHTFSVTGGGAMHLNDALGHQEGMKVTYNHHEPLLLSAMQELIIEWRHYALPQVRGEQMLLQE